MASGTISGVEVGTAVGSGVAMTAGVADAVGVGELLTGANVGSGEPVGLSATTDAQPVASRLKMMTNTTGWNLQLDKGKYGIVKGDYNDSLTSLIVTELFDVTLYQHSGYSGHYLNISGPYTISSLSSYFMDSKHSWNDTVSSARIKCKSGFGE